MGNPGPTSGLSESTSRSLLERAKENDPSAWERLTRLYGPDVYRWARQTGMQASDARDVVQEVFRAVARSLGTFRKERPGDAFRGWLWTVTRNKIRDHFNKQSAQPTAEGGSQAQQKLHDLPAAAPDSAEETSQRSVSRTLVHRAIDLMRTDFEERTWQAFWRTAVDESPPADVADELGMSVAAVYKARSRVLRRLRQELDGLDLLG